ncbi:preprotein translocase subunit YajC [Solibacillus kalamii]|uniref:Preprotein translocase subunit YajC n=2 Tax=Solibacillus TaxID=648800 RepID=K1L176_9BACL|nr:MULTISPECIES: preprotein translocase subunit YajC [Solibacillus]AMO86160.1 preprotein translocase subunit YajC [Solibacillus silvestris]EKB45852.1 preprotein translocase subunit YajC [Solibacillus isronensis B3W22]MBM7664406.1 preprotein translocase subunit YajC [Solibacillus kalamii]OUZ39836.1 preprotein translocase subunit YajC [Solibacillus kalamii]
MEGLVQFLPIIVMFVAMWFILIRPAQKRQKATATMQNSLKRGDKVVTVGGLHGEVDAIEDTTVYLLVDGNTRLKFERQAIGRIESV